jgi:acyl-coenzyme A thioesterase PaaI-like protein
VWEGRVVAVGSVVKAGRTIALTDCRVTDESGSLVAYATSTCMTLRE